MSVKYHRSGDEMLNTYSESGGGQNSSQQLDTEFDQNLASMKKYILDLKDRKSKQLCALWIKKLCETSAENNDSFQSKCIRNQYSLQLLSLLENYEPLKYPFSERPPNENLKSYEEVIERRNFERPNKTSKDESTNNDAIYGNNSFDAIFSDQMFDYQMKLLENRFKEEKINLQQYHSDELQKILDRKNGEIETLKTNMNRKKKEYEDNIANLERKVQSLSKQIILDRETYEKELNDLKYQYEKNQEKKQFEIEKKLNEMVNKYEKEKFDLQKSNTKAFQDLVDETNMRLKKVESEYNQQQLINDKVIYELENRTQLLKAEMEKNISLTKSLEQENQEKQALIESLQKRLNEEINKNSYLENEINNLKESKNREINQLTSKYETMLDSKMRELESHANGLHDELELLKSDYEKRIDRLNLALKEKDIALQNANSTIKQQKLQAEHALNELKIDIERNSNKLYEEMKNQMTKVENDLDKSKSIREKQSKEFNKQIEHLKSEHKKEIEKLNNDFTKEKQRIHSSHEKLYSQIQNQFHQQLLDANLSSKLRVDEMTQTISRLERELFESNELRKQQITELGLIRQDEKIKNELEIERIRSNYEHELSTMKKRWKEEKETSREDGKVRDERIRRLTERVSDLEGSLNSERGENKRLKEALEREKDDCYSAIEAEKTALKRSYVTQINEFEKELDMEKAKCKSIEKKIKQMSYEYEQNVLDLKMHYEERMKGLLPLSIKNDYEETISALRSQVDSLQQRALILQSDLDERHQMINSSKSSI